MYHGQMKYGGFIMKKVIALCLVIVMCLSPVAVSGNEYANQDNIARIEEMLQGTWEYRGKSSDSDVVSCHIFEFYKGTLYYKSYFEGYENSIHSSWGTYLVKEEGIDNIYENYTSHLKYELKGDNLVLSWYVESGADKGVTYYYTKTSEQTPDIPSSTGSEKNNLETHSVSASNVTLESATIQLLDGAYKFYDLEISYMLRAWKFSIDHASASSFEEFAALWGQFGTCMNMSEDDMVDALMGLGWTLEMLSAGSDPEKGLNTVIDGMAFMRAGTSVPAAKYIFEKRYKVTDTSKGAETDGAVDIDAILDTIKQSLRQLKGKSEAYDVLKEYYLMVREMGNWIDNPTGNYKEISSNQDDYAKKAGSFRGEFDLLID